MAKDKLIAKQPFSGKVAMVCGASEGIGKATAKEIVLLGGSVAIIARNIDKLNAAKVDIEGAKVNDSQFVEIISCDATDMDKLKLLIEGFIKEKGVPDYLINVVGNALPDYIQNLTLEDYKKHMDMNYYGQLVPTLILIPHYMKAEKGHISFVSSVAAYIGIIGYTMYTPTKAAILGLADSLRNELSPYKIKISVLFPPDTNTPAFEIENIKKPKECAIMSERGGVLEPEEVAEPYIEGILKNKFYILPGEAGFLWWAKRHLTGYVNKATDKELRKARKKLGMSYKY